MSDRVSIQGIQEAQRANLRAIAVMQPKGRLGRALQITLADLHRYAVSITHVWIYYGGALRASHRIADLVISDNQARGEIFLDPTAVNPRGQRPAEYGVYEHARGGEHAFYELTIENAGPRAAGRAMQFLMEGLDGN